MKTINFTTEEYSTILEAITKIEPYLINIERIIGLAESSDKEYPAFNLFKKQSHAFSKSIVILKGKFSEFYETIKENL